MEASWTSRTLVLLFLYHLCSHIDAIVYKSLVWSPENPIFVEDKIKCVFPKSRLNIICPSLPVIVADTERAQIKENLYENLWLVDRMAYDSCHVAKQDSNNKKLLLCDTPLQLKSYTITFHEMSPTLKGLEFKPGNDYFLIATSDGTQNSLAHTKGGHCKTRNMKLRFYMCNDSKDPHCLSEETCQQLLKKQIFHSDPGRTLGEGEFNDNATLIAPNTTISPSPPNVPNETFPPNRQYLDSYKEVQYRLSIGLLGFLCFLLLALSACLGYRLHRNRKQQSKCIENENFAVRLSRASEGADSADGEDSNMLVLRDSIGFKAI